MKGFAPLATRIGFPAVLGELLLGVVLGNLGLVGIHYFESISRDPIILFLAELGVIVLMLQIGLETRLADLIKVGGRAAAVGVTGIILPFVLTGMQVDLATLTDPSIVAVSLGVTAAAIIGKLLAGFAAGKRSRAWVVGWGMVPRGEVGLIFAMVGKQLEVISEGMFSVVVIMVIFTTLIAPPVLTWILNRQQSPVAGE